MRPVGPDHPRPSFGFYIIVSAFSGGVKRRFDDLNAILSAGRRTERKKAAVRQAQAQWRIGFDMEGSVVYAHPQ